jgi:hypothetical protein
MQSGIVLAKPIKCRIYDPFRHLRRSAGSYFEFAKHSPHTWSSPRDKITPSANIPSFSLEDVILKSKACILNRILSTEPAGVKK